MTDLPARSTCRSCGAPIRWARTTTGKRIPLDADPNPTGNVALDAHDRAVVLDPQGSLLDDDDPWRGDRYAAHFATCPDADLWRRSRD